MRESRTYGSVRGALSNGRPYRVTAETDFFLIRRSKVRIQFLHERHELVEVF